MMDVGLPSIINMDGYKCTGNRGLLHVTSPIDTEYFSLCKGCFCQQIFMIGRDTAMTSTRSFL